MNLGKCALIATTGLAIVPFHSVAYAKNTVDVEVIDPYVEMHSGPGRGYPVFYVIEQGEKVEIITRRPGWYEVKTQNGKTGWTSTAQISRTIQTTGEPADLPAVSHGDYLKNRWRVGFSSGEMVSGELKNSEMFSATLGYRPLSWLGVEAEAGKIFGSDVKGSFYGLNLVAEPFSEWVVSPLLVVGSGKLSIDTQPKLFPLRINESNYNQVGLGFNYYIGRNFQFNAAVHSYSVSTEKNKETLQSWTLGFNTFF